MQCTCNKCVCRVGAAPYTPVGSTTELFPGTWFLTHVDDKHRRQYERHPLQSHGAGDMVAEAQGSEVPPVSTGGSEGGGGGV